MSSAFDLDLKKLKARAFDRADWAEHVLRQYHDVGSAGGDQAVRPLRGLYEWMFVPPTLWPFNIQDVLADCLKTLQKGNRLNARQSVLIELLPTPPDESVCLAAGEHEFFIQKGTYENLVKTQAKYRQTEVTIKSDRQLHCQWGRIKAVFKVKNHQDHKGVIRRTMSTERNLRPSFSVDMRREADAFQAAFDSFCLRWNLYGMQHDEPLLLKLAVNLTPYGTMIHIPAYWSFDPKRDIRWDAIAKLHRTRVPGRQGSVLADGVSERRLNAEKLFHLDREVRRLGLKGERKHKFLCDGLGWVAETSAKRISRLRAEFKNQRATESAK